MKLSLQQILERIPYISDPKTAELLREAYIYGLEHSDDVDTKLGALLVDNTTGRIIIYGANQFPSGIDGRPERHERPLKYHFIEHAERFVIYKAAEQGISTSDLIMYCPWYAADPDSARAIINAGIKTVVGHLEMMMRTPEWWQESMIIALEMLLEAGVQLLVYQGKIGDVKNLFNKQEWYP